MDLRDHVKSLADPGKRTHVNPKYPALDPPRSSTPPPYEDAVLKKLKEFADFDRQEREREINRKKRSGIPIIPPTASIKRRRAMGQFLPPPLSFEEYKPTPRATNAVICYREYLAKKEKEAALSTGNGDKSGTERSEDANQAQRDKDNESEKKKTNLGVGIGGSLKKKSQKAKSSKTVLQNAVQRDMSAGTFPFQLSPEALKRIADRRAKRQAELEAKWAAPKKLFLLPGEEDPAPAKKKAASVNGPAHAESSVAAGGSESVGHRHTKDGDIQPVAEEGMPVGRRLGDAPSSSNVADATESALVSTARFDGSCAEENKPKENNNSTTGTASTQIVDKKLSLAEIKLREADAKLAEAKAIEERVAKLKADFEAAKAEAARMRKEVEQRRDTEVEERRQETASKSTEVNSALQPHDANQDGSVKETGEAKGDGAVEDKNKGGFLMAKGAKDEFTPAEVRSNPFAAKPTASNPFADSAAKGNLFQNNFLQTPAPRNDGTFQAAAEKTKTTESFLGSASTSAAPSVLAPQTTVSGSESFAPPGTSGSQSLFGSKSTSASKSLQAPAVPGNDFQTKTFGLESSTPGFGGIAAIGQAPAAQPKELDSKPSGREPMGGSDFMTHHKDSKLMFGAGKLSNFNTKATDSAAKPETPHNTETVPEDDKDTSTDVAEEVKASEQTDQEKLTSVEQSEQGDDNGEVEKKPDEPVKAEITQTAPATKDDDKIQPFVPAAPSNPFLAAIDVNNPFQLKTSTQHDGAPMFGGNATTNIPSQNNLSMSDKNTSDPVPTEQKPSTVSALGKRSASVSENNEETKENETDDNPPAKRPTSAFPFGSSFGAAAPTPIFGSTPAHQVEKPGNDANDKDPMNSATKDDGNDAAPVAPKNPFALGSGTTFGAIGSGPIFGSGAPAAKPDGGPFADSKFSANAAPVNFSKFVFGANKPESAPPSQAQSNPGFGFGDNKPSVTGFQFGSTPSAPGGLGSQTPTVFGGSAPAAAAPAPTTFGVSAPVQAPASTPAPGTLNGGNPAGGNPAFGAPSSGTPLFGGSFPAANPFGSGGGSGFGADPFAQAQNPSAAPAPTAPAPGANPFTFNQAQAQPPSGGNASFSIGSTAAGLPRRRVRVRRTLNQR